MGFGKTAVALGGCRQVAALKFQSLRFFKQPEWDRRGRYCFGLIEDARPEAFLGESNPFSRCQLVFDVGEPALDGEGQLAGRQL